MFAFVSAISFMNYLIASADPSGNLGRIDYASLSQQTLMEMLVEQITNRETLWNGGKEDPRDFSEWEGITLNDNGDVTHIKWQGMSLEGTPLLEWLPQTLTSLVLSFNNLCGTIAWENIQPDLVTFSVMRNKLSGEIDLSYLSDDLQSFDIKENQFIGTLALEDLPNAMNYFSADDNSFSGTVNLAALPDDLYTFSVGNNQLSGSVDLTQLPIYLIDLVLEGNAFSGTVDLRSLPQEVECVHLSRNNFEGETDFRELPDSLIQLEVFQNENLSGFLEINVEESLPRMRSFRVSDTNLRGTIRVARGRNGNFSVKGTQVQLVNT